MKLTDVFTPTATPDILRITQAAHGFAVGDAVRRDGSLSIYVKAMGDTGDHAEAIGLVSYVNGDDLIVTLSGAITGLSGLTDGQVYKLSWNIPGGLTNESIPVGAIDKPLLLATSSTGGIVLQSRGAMALVTGEPQATLTYKPALTVGQTVITLPWNYTIGVNQLFVIKNGVVQSDTQYTETGINEITLLTATVYGDIVVVTRMPNGCVQQSGIWPAWIGV